MENPTLTQFERLVRGSPDYVEAVILNVLYNRMLNVSRQTFTRPTEAFTLYV